MKNPLQSDKRLLQIIPNEVCFSCDVCCRFLEVDSPLAPIFTESETEAVLSQGVNPSQFLRQPDGKSHQIRLKPYKDFYICPFFAPVTGHCTIYASRPLDCQLYPFALMFNEDRSEVVIGVDTLCPFGETHLKTEVFQKQIRHLIDYVESETVATQIASNWSLIGDYQDTVEIVHILKNAVKVHRNLKPHATSSTNSR